VLQSICIAESIMKMPGMVNLVVGVVTRLLEYLLHRCHLLDGIFRVLQGAV
jgi:hypothetical protein